MKPLTLILLLALCGCDGHITPPAPYADVETNAVSKPYYSPTDAEFSNAMNNKKHGGIGWEKASIRYE